MAGSKTSEAAVVSKTHDDGSISIGIEVEGYFVPFVTLAPYRLAQLVENATNVAASSASASAEEESS